MASFNKVILVGNVTRDPELRYISSGTAVTDIGLAVNDRRKNAQGEWVEETTFVDVTLWGRTAEVAGEYVSKGSPLLIEGRLKLDQWEKDGMVEFQDRRTGDTLTGQEIASLLRVHYYVHHRREAVETNNDELEQDLCKK